MPFTIKPVQRVIAICSSCGEESEPVDFVCSVPLPAENYAPVPDLVDAASESFAKAGWHLTYDGVWCAACKGLPR